MLETVRPSVYLHGERIQMGQVIVGRPTRKRPLEAGTDMRETIDFGIDLGTTNSAIAVAGDDGVRVIKNNDGAEFTPSAVWIPRRARSTSGCGPGTVR
ncbi:Hsp70 family protein [Streptomyces sp. M19]